MSASYREHPGARGEARSDKGGKWLPAKRDAADV